jgi:hypothetical protein
MPFAAGTLTPAIFRRAFFVFVSLVAFSASGGLARAANIPVKPPELSQAGKADPKEAAQILEQFRRSGIPGEYYLEFELHALPRRGEERVFQGRLWGGRNPQGAISRVELTDASNQKHRLLIQNGEQAAVWKFAQGKPVRLTVAELFQPLIPGVEVTAFDVQMPFLYWPDATLEKIARMRGRPSNAFVFRAPESFTKAHGEVIAARAYLDTQFNALMQTELIGKNNRVVKTFSLLNFKNVDRQPLPKSADYRNEITRDKTRLVVTAAALNLKLGAGVFEPESLARDAQPPARDQIVSLD